MEGIKEFRVNNGLTQLGTMSIKDHYVITRLNPKALAGNDCCKWHLKMKSPQT